MNHDPSAAPADDDHHTERDGEHHGHSHGSADEPAHAPRIDEDDRSLSDYQVLEIALRELLINKGVVTAAELRALHEKMDQRGPLNGARMVARAWCDADYLQLLRDDASAAARSLGLEPTWLNLIAVENTPETHNLVVCTLCSCYPWPLLGLPPDWYKSRTYRSDAVRRPREVLRQFGTVLPAEVEIRVHDSTADMRYLVIPMRPAGTEAWSQESLAGLVTRDSMIGVTQALAQPLHG